MYLFCIFLLIVYLLVCDFHCLGSLVVRTSNVQGQTRFAKMNRCADRDGRQCSTIKARDKEQLEELVGGGHKHGR